MRDNSAEDRYEIWVPLAVEIAARAHRGVTGKDGRPYILHPLRLMHAAATDDERIVAVLHDTVEDTEVTLEDLARAGLVHHIVTAATKVGCGLETTMTNKRDFGSTFGRGFGGAFDFLRSGKTGDEADVREKFWTTARKAARHIPFMEDVVAAYYCALDKNTPLRAKAILLARFIPVVRTVLNPLAGILAVPTRVFTLWQVVGGLVWSVGVTFAGYGLGASIPGIDKYLLPAVAVIVVVSVIPIGLELLRTHRAASTKNGDRDGDGNGNGAAEQTAILPRTPRR